MKEEFRNILLDKLSEEEREEFFTRLQEDPSIESEFKESFLLGLVDRMRNMKISSSEKGKRFKKLWFIARSKQDMMRKLVTIGQAAAIVGLAIFSANLLYSNINRTESYAVKSERGSVSVTEISDEAEVWLNTSTKMEVIEKGEKEVTVSLDGEGYFEVDHNPKRDFIVDLGKYQVRDIGTSFNIKSYPDDDKIIISVYDGIAYLETTDSKLLRSLKGGEGIEIDLETGAMMARQSNYLSDTDWKEGKFAFEQARFSDIILEFEEWYDVTFEVKDKSVNNQLFTGVLKRKSSIVDLMRILKMTSDFEYKIEIENDGSSLVYIY